MPATTSLRELSTSLLSGAIPIERAYPMVPRFQAEPVAARSTFVASFANVTAFDTDDGLVLIDTGSFLLAERTRAALRAAIAAPAHTAIWTHGHVDHCFGVELYEGEAGRAVRAERCTDTSQVQLTATRPRSSWRTACRRGR